MNENAFFVALLVVWLCAAVLFCGSPDVHDGMVHRLEVKP